MNAAAVFEERKDDFLALIESAEEVPSASLLQEECRIILKRRESALMSVLQRCPL